MDKPKLNRRKLLLAGSVAPLMYVGESRAQDRSSAGKSGGATSHDVRNFGAVGDGRTDDTAAFQKAIDATSGAGIVFVPIGQYKVGNLTLPSNVTLMGERAIFNGSDFSKASCLVGTPGIDLLTLSTATDGASTKYAQNIAITNLVFLGGKDGIVIGGVGGAVRLDLDFVRLHGQQSSGIHVSSWLERSSFKNLEITGSDIGFNVSNSGNINNYIDKCVFIDCRLSGRKNGLSVDTFRPSNACTWINLVLNGCGEHCAKLLGSCLDWTFINAATELNGTDGPELAVSSGRISSGSNAFVTNSAGALKSGQSITISGAGANGRDLQSTVTAVDGDTVHLRDAAQNDIEGGEMTNAVFDEFFLGTPSIGAKVGPSRINFVGGFFGPAGRFDRIRYFCNISGGSDRIAFYNCEWRRPVNDPGSSGVYFATRGPIRSEKGQPSANSYRHLRVAESSNGPSVYPGETGFGSVHSLRSGSAGGRVTSFGAFRVVRSNSGEELLSVDGDTADVTINGGKTGGGNLRIGGNAKAKGGLAICISDTNQAPTSLAGCGSLYVENGDLKYIGPNGHPQTIAKG